ncbi:hypothetical protein FE391_01490 [Nonomuraea sp. KC401]|uniref:hypothetical protein n=1 Tax=unclassified Nonomuraea TaxID=2593643 RepID=UPI0010FD18ED|nr:MULTISPECIES: hypothetical protein [unclassified Nonomuraea]NBE92136.1 hypothetical protein [Nonomuraea sp. K271]TLF85633.1 hypothetical protein FE391_01490 [Nonomuraea sp. KC401]
MEPAPRRPRPEPRGTVWDRTRGPPGAWASGATGIDANGGISDVSAAALPDGSPHVRTLVPGAASGTVRAARPGPGTARG